MVAQHHQTAQRRARHHGLLPRGQQAHIRDVKPIDIFFRGNRIDHQILVQMAGQGQLHQNPMHRGIGIQLRNQRQQISLGCGSVQLMLERVHAHLDRLLALRAHIDLACRIFPHQNNSQPRGNAMGRFHLGHMLGHLGAHLGGKGLAINDLGSHRSSLLRHLAGNSFPGNVASAYAWPAPRYASKSPLLPGQRRPAPG